MKDWLMNFLKGLFMGAADILPGVSGGTIAFITGIYTRLVDGIAYVAESLKPKEFKELFQRIKKFDYALFIPLILGIALAVKTMSSVLNDLLTSHPATMYSFFFGLILASSIYVFRSIEDKSSRKTIFSWSIIGFIIAFLITGISQTTTANNPVTLFLSGAVAITAMILPGISGAMILLILGKYHYVVSLLADLKIGELMYFGVGAITGLLLFSELLHYLLHKRKDATMSFLTGLMVGSLRLPVEVVMSQMENVVLVSAALIIGFVLVVVVERAANVKY